MVSWHRNVPHAVATIQTARERIYSPPREQIGRQESLKVDLTVTLLKIMALSEKSSKHDLREYYFMYETSIYSHSAF